MIETISDPKQIDPNDSVRARQSARVDVSDWRSWVEWCHQLVTVPAVETMTMLRHTHVAQKKMSTMPMRMPNFLPALYSSPWLMYSPWLMAAYVAMIHTNAHPICTIVKSTAMSRITG